MKSPCDKSREYSGIITGPDYSHSTKLQPKRFDPILGKPSDFDEQVNLMFGSFRITQSEMKKMVAGH